MGLKQEFNFREYLTNNIDGYDGKYAKYILMIPILYDALCSILKSTTLPQSLRADIYLTFGYLYYPEDLYPEEELGPLGFLDDLTGKDWNRIHRRTSYRAGLFDQSAADQ